MKSTCLSNLSGVISQGLRKFYLLLPLIFISSPVFSQQIIHNMARDSYFFDFLTFKAFDGDKTFLEVFCKIPFKSLKFTQTPLGLIAYYNLELTLFNKKNMLVETSSYTNSVKVDSYREAKNLSTHSEIIRFTFVVEPDDYKAHMTITDNQSPVFKGFRRNLHVPNYTEKGLQASDIQMATSITTTDQQTILVKNGREIVPNVSHIYGKGARVLYVYSELYNLHHKRKSNLNEFLATFTIIDQNGQKVKKFQHKQNKPGKTCAFSLGIPVGDLKSGQYKLVMDVIDLDNSKTVTKETNFHIIKDRSERGIVI